MTDFEENTISYTEEITSFEEYWISGLPKSIRTAVVEIYEDFMTLSCDPQNPVFSIASGLLGIPLQILAMHRAISPGYYLHFTCGNMYRHNDSVWLAERLKESIKEWNKRSNIILPSRSISDIDSEIARLESFGKRGFNYELNFQKEKITNMLAGMQNFFRQDNNEKKMTSAVVLYIRKQASLWKGILKLSAWADATGDLINTVANKIIKDVFDLPDIGIEEAERTSAIISEIETLDDLFTYQLDLSVQQEASDSNLAVVPLTAQFADKWMKMKFLSEALQSNLKDVKFLWFESDLSLYFTAEEVIELIKLCFVMNTGVRQAMKEIKDNPRPRENE